MKIKISVIDVKKKVLIICGDDVHDMCASKRSQSNLNNILITFLFVSVFAKKKCRCVKVIIIIE